MDGFKGLSTVVLERRMHTQLISRIFVTHGPSLPLAFLGKFFLIAKFIANILEKDIETPLKETKNLITTFQKT